MSRSLLSIPKTTHLRLPTTDNPTQALRLLVLAPDGQVGPVLAEMIEHHPVEMEVVDSCQKACDPALLARVDAVIACDPVGEDGPGTPLGYQELEWLSDALLSQRLTGLWLSIREDFYSDQPALPRIRPDLSPEELWGRLATIRQYRPLLARIEEQVSVMQRLGKKLNQQFVEVDQELRLASRLQRDFLPKQFPELGPLRFAALYRPASWVSGDVYDVQRLDESRIGFYLADAVGHGVAAGLLTMFIKQAVLGKTIEGDSYQIIPPELVLAKLNMELSNQQLPNCQFVTACYGTIDASTCAIEYSRGGHPHPIHVGSEGVCSEARTVGGLLGVFPEESYPSASMVLGPGEKFIIYSDGIEDFIIDRRNRQTGQVHFAQPFLELVRLPLGRFMERFAALLDRSEGSLQPDDDMTVLAIERLPE